MGVGVLKALIFGADGFEDVELIYPYHRLKEEGVDTQIVSMEKGKITGKHGYSVEADAAFRDIDPSKYDLLVISGGKGPEKMRLDESALEITRHFFKQNKPVAAICHGPQVLIKVKIF
jgi:protease I